MAWEALGIGVLKGLLSCWWNRRRVKITRIFLEKASSGPSLKAIRPSGQVDFHLMHDRELRAEVYNGGNREVYIRAVAVEGAGQPPMHLFADKLAALERGDRRIYDRSISDLQHFASQKAVRVVVRSNLTGKRGVLARRDIPPSWWP